MGGNYGLLGPALCSAQEKGRRVASDAILALQVGPALGLEDCNW